MGEREWGKAGMRGEKNNGESRSREVQEGSARETQGRENWGTLA